MKIARAFATTLIFFSLATSSRATDSVDESEIGQILIVGFYGTDVKSTGFIEILRNLESERIGGVLFLPRNMKSRETLKEMTSAVINCDCKHVPFIAVDEEGGKIQRLGPKLNETNIPSAIDISRLTGNQARTVFDSIAYKVQDYGFNLNFGPVVDLNLNPKNKVISGLGRSFSDNPQKVTEFARSFIDAHHARNILTSLKHFPGHGSATEDTHRSSANVTNVWKEIELIPYKKLIQTNSVDMIMVGHLSSKLWGGTATINGSTAITGLLRKDLKYNGVVITDDMYMGAVRNKEMTAVRASVSAISAGSDLIILSRTENTEEDVGLSLYNEVKRSLETKEIPSKQLEISIERVLNLKKKLESSDN